ncbi:hypothetical protein HDU91_006872 [Kappamyces sp. JEL0680]|nr:hypothetical protein HDU91_006872 [Kappamyces sp. JEL0680]
MAEEKATLKKEIKVLSQNLVQEQERNETAEKTIETRVVKKQDSFVSDMKNTIKKLESELKATKEHTGKREVALNQKIEYLKSKFESVNANYLALKKRRDYEIEGFTSDIINLRNQLRLLEKSILKYGSLEDKEMNREQYYNSLSPEMKKKLLKICKSGAENHDSSVGMYAQNPDDYDVFSAYFDKVIREYHKIQGDKLHVTNWDLTTKSEKLAQLGCADGQLDLTKLGLDKVSMRVRVGRNLSTFPLPGSMTKADRVNMENKMIVAFKNLIADPAFGGQYYSLTPGNSHHINDTKYQELVGEHIMFKDMSNDPYLNSAGISSHWPYGRGCYVSQDREFIVWVGEEDHLRIMCMMQGTVLNKVFDRLQAAEKIVEKHADAFARSKSYGFVTSCPTNLGTGMRASLHLKLPFLTADGTDKQAKAVCKPLGLSVRGLGGEHTPIGADGTVDISPSARLMIEEADIICSLYNGVKLLLEAEKTAGKSYNEEQIKKIVAAKSANPDNLMAKHFDASYFNGLSNDALRLRLVQICRSGFENTER